MSSIVFSRLAATGALLWLTAAPVAQGEERDPAAPSVTQPVAVEVDYAPTAAIPSQSRGFVAPRLDLAPPPGLAPELPPEAPPAFVQQSALDATAAAPASSDAMGAAIADSLERFVAAKPVGHPVGAADWAAARRGVAAVYAERGGAPLWIEGEGFGARARQALARLARAGDDGLDLAASPPPEADFKSASPATLAEADVALSAAVVAYAMQASGSRINPRALSKDVSARPEVADSAIALKGVASAPDSDAALAAFNPPQAGYRALRDALAQLRAMSARAESSLAPGPVLKLGMSDPRVPLIRARFGLFASSDPVSQIYDIRVASAVAAFQRVHGLPPNGSLTPATATALESGGAPTGRERLLKANMEMWRWEPREMGAVRVEVNVPDFSLKLMSGESVLLRTRVIVGKPDTPTPIFSNAIKYMLFNPVWRVPDSIIKKEMEPKLAGDPNYLERHGYKVSYVGDRLVVEQPPGEANALGRMLFLFPNEHAVYLHDTPGRSLFSASYRALSHGCVRVEDPSRLAEILMGGAARGWSEAKVRSLLGDKERAFSLPVPVPVHLQYFTLFAGEDGRLQERSDLYGLAAKVAGALPN